MLLTLRHWHANPYLFEEEQSSHEILFVGKSTTPQQVPELLLRPLPELPSKLLRHRKRQSITQQQEQYYKIACRVSVSDILRATRVMSLYNNGGERILLELPHGAAMELDCGTRTELVAAALQSRLPSTKWVTESTSALPMPELASALSDTTTSSSAGSTISPCASHDDDDDNEINVDRLTAACMRATAAQESLGDKLQRRWNKAVHDWTQIIMAETD